MTDYQHKVIDDILPKNIQMEILNDARNLRWMYTRSTYREKQGAIITTDVYDVGQLVCPVIGKDERTDYYEKLDPLLKALQEHLKPVIGIRRIKFNLTWRTPEANNRWQMPHVDNEDVIDRGNKWWSIVYYVNDSDGDTVLFYPYEKVRVSPKQGRALIFPAKMKHAGSNPNSSQDRIVINFVLETEKDEVPNL